MLSKLILARFIYEQTIIISVMKSHVSEASGSTKEYQIFIGILDCLH